MDRREEKRTTLHVEAPRVSRGSQGHFKVDELNRVGGKYTSKRGLECKRYACATCRMFYKHHQEITRGGNPSGSRLSTHLIPQANTFRVTEQ